MSPPTLGRASSGRYAVGFRVLSKASPGKVYFSAGGRRWDDAVLAAAMARADDEVIGKSVRHCVVNVSQRTVADPVSEHFVLGEPAVETESRAARAIRPTAVDPPRAAEPRAAEPRVPKGGLD